MVNDRIKPSNGTQRIRKKMPTQSETRSFDAENDHSASKPNYSFISNTNIGEMAQNSSQILLASMETKPISSEIDSYLVSLINRFNKC